MQPARQNRLHRVGVFTALAMLLGLIPLTLTQCRMVGDQITSVRPSATRAPTTCIKECNDRYKLLFEEERRRHQTNVENCQALPQPDRGACLEAEDARHTAEMDRLAQAKIDCQNDCHRQGAGGP